MSKPWTPFQDALLIDAADTFKKTWIQVKDRLPGRTSQECQERYLHLEKLGLAKPFPKSPMKPDLVTKPKQKKVSHSSPLGGYNKKRFSSPNRKTSPVKLFKKLFSPSPKRLKVMTHKLSPISKRKSKLFHESGQRPIAPKSLNRSPTKMQWKVINHNGNQIKPKPTINTLSSSQWNIHNDQTANSKYGLFYSSPVAQHDRKSPFVSHSREAKKHTVAPLASSPLGRSDLHLQTNFNDDFNLDDIFNFGNEGQPTPTDTCAIDDMFMNIPRNQMSTDINSMFSFQPNSSVAPTSEIDLESLFSHTAPIAQVDPFASCFAVPPPMNEITSEPDRFWDDLFQNQNQGSHCNEAALDQFLSGVSVTNTAQPLSQETVILDSNQKQDVSNMTITKDEVDDLFKDAVQEPQLLDTLSPAFEEVEWVTNNHDAFSKDQIEMLKVQLRQSFQLTVQGYILEKELRNSDTKEENRYFWQDQLNQLMHSREMGLAVTGQNSLFNIPGADRISQLGKIATVPSILFQRSYREHKKSQKNRTPIRLSNGIEQSLGLFRDVFDTSILPVISPVPVGRIAQFSPFEDQLLHRGLIAFGSSDIASIQSHFLPTKSRTTIKYRIMNATKRTRPSGSKLLHEYHLLPFKPLTVTERFILKQGILKYGIMFRNLLNCVFPHIPTGLIECVWNDLCRTGQVPIKWSGERVPCAYIPPAPSIYIANTNPQIMTNPHEIVRNYQSFLSSDIDIPTPEAFGVETQHTPVLNYDEPSPLEKVTNWNSDFETDVDDNKEPLTELTTNKSIERPKVSFAGFYDLESDDDNENAAMSPSPCGSPSYGENTLTLDRQIKGVGRGGTKKKPSRITKDIIESSNFSKIRRKFVDTARPLRPIDFLELQKSFKKRKQRPVSNKMGSTVDVLQVKEVKAL